MADDAPGEGGWLPPVAPGGNPPPRFDTPQWTAPRPAAPQPAATGADRLPPPPRFDAPKQASSPAAVWGLVLGITGLALLLLSLGTLFFITLPLSFAAMSLGKRAREAGQPSAALWIGRAGVIAGVAAAVVLIALVAAGVDFEELRRDIERELDRRRQDDEGGSGVDGVRSAVEGLRAFIGR
jgi:hypothetical protein